MLSQTQLQEIKTRWQQEGTNDDVPSQIEQLKADNAVLLSEVETLQKFIAIMLIDEIGETLENISKQYSGS